MADHHGHWSADDEYRETPPGAGHEHTDAQVGPIAKFMVWLTVLTVLSAVAMAGMYVWLINSRAESLADQRYPLGEISRDVPEPAGARLQTEPQEDLERFRGTERMLLERYGWVDEEAGIVRMPIDEAISLVLSQGLPEREGAAEDPMAATGSRPADSSSGRTEVVRRQ